MEFTTEADASGLPCPMPIIRAKKALARMSAGQVLRVISTDPGSVKDMAVLAERSGNPLLAHNRDKERFLFYFRKS